MASEYVQTICQEARRASYLLAGIPGALKDKALLHLAQKIRQHAKEIISQNALDLEEGKKNNLSPALLDRLKLTEARIESMAVSVDEIRALPDPVGEVVYSTVRPDGLVVHQERVPLGVFCVIFESRPNVVIDISALAIKSGNAAILRGGKEAFASNQILGRLVSESLAEAGLPGSAIHVLNQTDRSLLDELLKQKQHIDLVVPRGGEGLIRYVSETSLIPVVKHDKGVCHIYVDANAKRELVEAVVINSKAQRPGTCNAIENLLIHEAYPFAKELIAALLSAKIEVRGDEKCQQFSSQVKPVTEEDWDMEYLDLILAVKMVSGLEEAMTFIRKHSSGHTEAILTEHYSNATRFQTEIDAACVFVNASTRLADGSCFGLGAEVGISTQKLHVRGPMGVRDLTCLKYKVSGTGQLRV